MPGKRRSPVADHEQKLEILSRIIGWEPAQRLMHEFGTLTAIGRESSSMLRKVAGIGFPKAQLLKASFELASVLSSEKLPEPYVVQNSDHAANLLRERFRLLKTEELHVILLDGSDHLLKDVVVPPGSPTICGIQPRQVFQYVFDYRAAAFVLAHNHPGADHTPSLADISFTAQVYHASKQLGVRFHDHIVMGVPTESYDSDYSSFLDLDLFPS